jgi:hypothetical protein
MISGANPRDVKIDTIGSRGLDMSACREMLCEAGFTALQRGDNTSLPLDLDYLLRQGGVPAR